ncbi:MAG: RIP metalloprotease RseP [Candidatus Portnoybacteria bacterium]|nr:RIP metalloprotease RseP [Candidatus Portnoybacteria bacterium]
MTILIFIIILGILIFIHELGHFAMAKKSGVRVDEFGFGFPPRLIGLQKRGRKWKFLFWSQKPEAGGETVYSLNLIPLGGFVKIFGEEGEGSGAKDSFVSKKARSKAAILLAGVFMNFILAVFLFGLGHFLGLPTALSDEEAAKFPDSRVAIVGVSSASPAQEAGLAAGDQILGYIENGRLIEIKNTAQFQSIADRKKGQDLLLDFKRGDSQMEIKLIPRENPPSGEGPLGVELANVAEVSYSWYESIYRGFTATISLTFALLAAFYEIIKNLIVDGRAGMDVSGPVGIFNLTGQAAQMGFIYLIQLTALLSINLAVINAFPFPALDGGRVLFLAIEKINGSPVSQKVQNLIHATGFVFLIILMLFITYRDIAKLIGS